jgi:hypothetical protein
MFDSIYIFVPEENRVVLIAEGSGDNLFDEDIENGYVDYIYYETYALPDNIEEDMHELDGGMVMLTEMFREKYETTEACVPDVLDMAFGQATLDWILFEK